MADATPAASPLRRHMIDDMTLRNLSPATQRSYLHAVAKFSRYFDRSPDRLGPEDVRAFQVYLVSRGISWPALNQTVCALRFFCGVTLNRAEIPERTAYARAPGKLPTIPSADEVVHFLEAVPSLKERAALTTAHAAGLRASEAVSLKVADIFRRHGPAYVQAHDGHLGRVERRVMSATELCRTAALGGHVEGCRACGAVRVACNSCRNRHCPKCQSAVARDWLEARATDLLPVPYFHVVFTLPARIAPTFARQAHEHSPPCSNPLATSPIYTHPKNAGTTSRLPDMSQVSLETLYRVSSQ